MAVNIRKLIIFWNTKKIQFLGGERREIVGKVNKLGCRTDIRAADITLDKITIFTTKKQK